ncbi:MAG: PEP-CTERM sorting domain-containing protein [Novosphingobium sp.]
MATLLTAAPAWATDSIANAIVLPEPSSTVLLGIGVLGLLIGRRAARKREDD